MGTSRSLRTPSGGGWSAVKTAITGHFSGRSLSPRQLACDVVEAGNGFGVGRGAGGDRPISNISGSVGGATADLGGFGGGVAEGGLDAGLRTLGLDTSTGKSAAEVVSAVASHLAREVDGVDGEVLRNALTDTLLEAATLTVDADKGALERGLQTFLAENRAEGLVEAFLCHYVFDVIWINIESYVQSRCTDETSFQAFMSSVEEACRDDVRAAVGQAKERGRFDRLDWFGTDGRQVGREVIADLELRFRNLL
ncbi:MAG TPA: hypothetical protein VHC22_08670 [Pirellulales bacterium]|nr:hypothetical protein [Pirellulales bacterium]